VRNNLRQCISRHAVAAPTVTLIKSHAARPVRASNIGSRNETVFFASKIDSGCCNRALAESHRSSSTVRLLGVAKVHELPCRSENTQVATGIYDPCHDALAFQNSTARSTAKPFAIRRNQSITGDESDMAGDFKNYIAPAAPAKTRTVPRKIIPFHQLPGHCDVENAIGVMRKFLRGFQDAPCPRMNAHQFVTRVAVSCARPAFGIVKTHQLLHARDRQKCRFDGIFHSAALVPNA